MIDVVAENKQSSTFLRNFIQLVKVTNPIFEGLSIEINKRSRWQRLMSIVKSTQFFLNFLLTQKGRKFNFVANVIVMSIGTI